MLSSVCNLVAALPSRELSSESKEVWDVQSADEILVSPVLLNSQETTRFCLAKGPRMRYSQTIHVNTVGECRMPFVLLQKTAMQPSCHMFPLRMPNIVLSGGQVATPACTHQLLMT